MDLDGIPSLNNGSLRHSTNARCRCPKDGQSADGTIVSPKTRCPRQSTKERNE